MKNQIRNFLVLGLVLACVPLFGKLEERMFIDENAAPAVQKLNAQLFVALFEGDTARVKQLLENGADANAKTTFYSFAYAATALSLVANSRNHMIKNRVETAKVLLEHGADMNSFDEYGHTPLIAAAMRENIPLCKLLIEHGADVNGKDKWGNTVLSLSKSSKIRKLFISAGAHTTPDYIKLMNQQELDEQLINAIYAKNFDEAKQALIHGANVNAKRNEVWNATPLAVAAYLGHENICELLIKHGATVNIDARAQIHQVLLSSTPVGFAAAGGHLSVCKLLVKHGADVNKANYGDTPIMYAAKDGHLAICRYLIGQGAKVNASTRDYGITALVEAIKGNHQSVIKLLKAHGAKATKSSLNRELIQAAKEGALSTCERFIAHGADVNAKISVRTDYGDTEIITPLSSAKNSEVKKLLIAHGAKTNASTKVALTKKPRTTSWARMKTKIRNFFKRS